MTTTQPRYSAIAAGTPPAKMCSNTRHPHRPQSNAPGAGIVTQVLCEGRWRGASAGQAPGLAGALRITGAHCARRTVSDAHDDAPYHALLQTRSSRGRVCRRGRCGAVTAAIMRTHH